MELAGPAESGQTLHFENRFRHKDDSYRWLSWRAVSDHGHLCAVTRDVTDLKNAEEQLQASRRELARVSRQITVGAMTASIAHEVNQPLAAIVVNANAGLRWLARAEPDVDEVRSLLKRIISDGHRASRVIVSIRSMFGKDRCEMSPVSVNDLLGEVLALVHTELESHQISLKTETLDGLPRVMAERGLIMNAIEAMSSITDRERILEVRSRLCEHNHVQITVEDSGTGIDPNQMDRIFDAFFTTKTHGTGMGLSICRSIIESHGGRLWVSARSPYGSVFCMTLQSTDSWE
jgi:C4-dicarboxylate-specific signal transduction histidine kinase